MQTPPCVVFNFFLTSQKEEKKRYEEANHLAYSIKKKWHPVLLLGQALLW